ALTAAAKLAGSDGIVDAVYILQVPPQLSLDSGLEAEEAHGRQVLDSARLRARAKGLKIRTSLIRTRNPGAALVDEARRRGSDAIYFDTVHAPPSEGPMG